MQTTDMHNVTTVFNYVISVWAKCFQGGSLGFLPVSTDGLAVKDMTFSLPHITDLLNWNFNEFLESHCQES